MSFNNNNRNTCGPGDLGWGSGEPCRRPFSPFSQNNVFLLGKKKKLEEYEIQRKIDAIKSNQLRCQKDMQDFLTKLIALGSDRAMLINNFRSRLIQESQLINDQWRELENKIKFGSKGLDALESKLQELTPDPFVGIVNPLKKRKAVKEAYSEILVQEKKIKEEKAKIKKELLQEFGPKALTKLEKQLGD